MDKYKQFFIWMSLLQIHFAWTHLDTTTFRNVIYKRGLSHSKGVSPRQCMSICETNEHCWGVNYIGGPGYSRGECQVLYHSIATCDPANHRRVSSSINAFSMWVRPSCPLNGRKFGKSPRLKGKSLLSGGKPCLGSTLNWRVYDMTHLSDGAYATRPKSFLDCLDGCYQREGCAAIDFNFDYSTCFFYSSQQYENIVTMPVNTDDCCAHAKITCTRDESSTTTTTTYASTTTPPAITTTLTQNGSTKSTVRDTTIYSTRLAPAFTGPTSTVSSSQQPTIPDEDILDDIPDSGCPDQLIKFESSGRQGGFPVFDLASNTSVACKERCVKLGDNCTALDFDKDTRICYIFNETEPDNLRRGDRPCCDHFSKLNCEALKKLECYKHAAYTFLANPNEHSVILSDMPPLSPPDLEVVECPGICYQNLDYDPELEVFKLERGCNATIGARRSWRSCIGDPETFAFDTKCTCHFDRCNAVNTFLFHHLICHFSFDDHVEDLSGFNRHGVEHNVLYDPVTAVRSYSASFDGHTSYIHFPSWRLVHSEHISPSGRPVLSFTIAMWALRTQSASRDSMTLLSTFSRDLSSVQIVSELDISNPFAPMQTIKGSVIVNFTKFEVAAQAPLNDWFFMAFTLDGFQDPPILTLDIDIIEDLTPDATTYLTGITALDELTITNKGLYIGKQAQVIEQLDEPYYFEGNIDDIFCYDRSLSYQELMALRDMRLPIP